MGRVRANTCLVCCGEDVRACSVASVVSDSLGPHGQVPLSVELSGPEYYSGLPFPRDQTQISCLGMGVPVLPLVSSRPHSAALRLRVPPEGAEVSQPAEAWPCLFLVCSHFLPPLAEKSSLVAQTDGKVTTCNVGDMGLIPGLGTSTGEGGTDSILSGEFCEQRSLVGYRPWGCKESDAMERLSLSLGSFPRGSGGKEFACSVGDPGFDPCVGKIPWRRKWQPTPGFLPGESHGQRSPAGYSPWGLKESDTVERLTYTQLQNSLFGARGGEGVPERVCVCECEQEDLFCKSQSLITRGKEPRVASGPINGICLKVKKVPHPSVCTVNTCSLSKDT